MLLRMVDYVLVHIIRDEDDSESLSWEIKRVLKSS